MAIQSTIEASAGKFTPATRRVADLIRENPAAVLEMTISELAAACDTSVASVVRFCRTLGLSGYSQLRMSLATELGKESAQFGAGMTLGAEIAQSDTLQEMAAKVASLEMLAIDETVSGLDFAALERVVAAIDKAERILLFGIGASQFVAQDLHHKLFRIGRNAFLLSDPHEAWTAALLSPAGTVALGFSHSGTTADTVRYLEIAREAGSLTVGLTGSPDSPLARAANECLVSRARESRLRAGAMVSRIAQLAIVDCLFLGVARQRYDQTVDALKRTRDVTHPR
ncbi:MurR/RpiR family transcriptional regulator [Pelagibacterium luteolum]|uniref:Transcriptional regulator, RpiR family n=1 Tax=Pelagibacterium luteolum TaxID=440168 RepID=A0A1G7VQV1_9HYPH|nr:MurR/RpiR family transcriptional regulator [Pelagibacterium luteolum]SDG61928.1 transcriptional regulator, RpiR family [Pelagibacterium luteolum]